MCAFTLSMPGVGSWNGKWTGSEECHVIVRSISAEQAARAFNRTGDAEGSHYYSFGDGWAASVSVRAVDSKEARRLRRKSDGFCGYGWMVESIVAAGKIQVQAVPQ